MSCAKCSKKTDRPIEVVNGNSLTRCCRCSLLCCKIGCKKKTFKNGYCSSHIEFHSEKKEKFKGRVITEEDLQRRDAKFEEYDLFHRYLDQQRAFISYQCKRIASEHIDNGRNQLKMMEEKLMCTIQEHHDEVDQNLSDTKNMMIDIFKLNLELMSSRNEYFPGYKSHYKRYNSKFKEYKEHFDQHRQNKYKQEQRKAERTRRRYQEREENRKNNFHDYKEDSDDEPDLEDEETYFVRTSGPSILQEAFITLSIEYTNDYDEVRRAYKKSALKMHPDKHPGEEEIYKIKFLDVTTAYELICIKMFKSHM